jgi:hypothetical protein
MSKVCVVPIPAVFLRAVHLYLKCGKFEAMSKKAFGRYIYISSVNISTPV